ncbi:MAG: TraB/GumN family protein [Chitinophagaceae bacterium]|nr:TraB/GumN family protein [Chitinophagaceae bacterium]
MKHLSILFAAFFMQHLCNSNASNAQSNGNNALLWKISGNELNKPSYVYGTIHMICAADFSISDVLKQCFNAADKVYLEVDMDDPAMNMKMLQLSMLQGKKLSDFFSPEDYSKMNSFFRDSIGMPLTMLNAMKPFVLFSILTLKTLPCSQQESYEMSFVKMAREQNKEVLGLETVEDQMKVFDDMPDSVQAQMLLRYVNEFTQQKKDFAEMIELYKNKDLDALYKQIMSSPDIAGSEEALLFNRNKNWIPVIESAMKNESLFIAVGAGHLAGEQGVLNLLKEKGYKIEPVK